MPRIVAGTARGRRLAAPSGLTTRPTSDRTREALFSSLESLIGSWHGRTVLDLYAGSGAVGLEAASRGAARVLLVESDAAALRILHANVALLGLSGVEVSGQRVQAFASRAALRSQGSSPSGANSVDVVFADPPYELPAEDLRAVLLDLRVGGAIGPDTVVILERSTRDAPWVWPEGITSLRDKAYGEGTLWYGRAAGRIEPGS